MAISVEGCCTGAQLAAQLLKSAREISYGAHVSESQKEAEGLVYVQQHCAIVSLGAIHANIDYCNKGCGQGSLGASERFLQCAVIC